MILRIEHEPVVRIDDAVRVPLPAGVVTVALVVLPSLHLRQLSFVVPEVVPADAHPRRHVAHVVVAAVPAQVPCLLLRDEVTYTLFQIGELSIREIAHETGVSENLVKVRIFRAKEKLREILADLNV